MEKIVRPHQVPALVELANGNGNVEDLRQKYGDEVVDLLSSWLEELIASPDDKLVLVDRQRSGVCDANCMRRNTEQNLLCDVSNPQTIIAELNSLSDMNMREVRVRGYSLNELRDFISRMPRKRSIKDVL